MMPSRQRPGFSLLEAALSSVLVGVLLVAAMRTVAASAVSQRLASEQAVAQALAEGLLAEILPAAYREPDGSARFGTETGEATSSKATFDDIDDWHPWSESPPKQPDGTPLADLDGWSRRATVDWVAPHDLNTALQVETGVKRITVVVSHRGVDVCTRTAYRTEAP